MCVHRYSKESAYSASFRPILFLIILLLSGSLLAVEFEVEYIDNAAADFSARGWLQPDSLFQRNIKAALDIYGALLIGDETIQVDVTADRGVLRAGGTFTSGDLRFIDPDSRSVFEPGALTRIRTGSNPGHTETFGFDIQISFDPGFIESTYWFDPEPETRLAAAPNTQTDFVWVVMHEIGHGLGIAGTRDRNTSSSGYGEFSFSAKSLFDSLTSFKGGNSPEDDQGLPRELIFVGSESDSIFGQPVPITNLPRANVLASQNFYHLGDCSSPDVLRQSLMRGCFAPLGRAHITEIDLAVLKDMGYSVAELLPRYSSSDTNLRIPHVVVSNQGVFSVTLSLSDQDALEFTLVEADQVPLGTESPTTFANSSGILSIPRLKVIEGSQTTEFAVELKVIETSDPIRFRVVSAQPK